MDSSRRDDGSAGDVDYGTFGVGYAQHGRPERLLDPDARRSCSAWSFVAPAAVARFEARLRRDLETGAWEAKYGHLRTQPELDGSLRLIVRG
jgi:hypothetical protein